MLASPPAPALPLIGQPPGFLLIVLTAMCLVVFVVAAVRRWGPKLWLAVLVALALRLVAAVLTYGRTPKDVAVYFHDAGQAILDGYDPVTHLPDFQWNFLPLMPYVFAAEISTGIPWEAASKISPILADLVLVVLLAKLAGAEYGRRFALLYAVCPVAVLVTAVHGQVEPVALALGVAGLLVARRGRLFWSGVLVGLAIASKTWPVVLLPGVLREVPIRRWWQVLLGVGLMPLIFLLSVPLVLGESLTAAVEVLSSYRSLVGRWGWGGLLHLADLIEGIGYTSPKIDFYQPIGTAVTAVAVIGAILWFRHADGVTMTAAVLLLFLSVSIGFGTQYLLWPVPFVLLLGRRWGLAFVLAASCYTATFYLWVALLPGREDILDPILVWGSLPVIATALAAVPWSSGGPRRHEPNPGPEATASSRTDPVSPAAHSGGSSLAT
ncbi:glycosyltransferase family 87 protein [Solwaraspora sp. WMMD1047]|uniref:glycosyltransferase family 87 protein n=1 Tax=Solwaraspora sp. WMMD1047 TaxID=3016102 RepID=UPI0024163DE1|nr:glycosyltransferase family 87 protein [Solwaraspora sp. WMMD1047]MDG4830495.1 glycosyltransferase family 87 protein [Solwaraspora sp. WMMD1047]